MTPWGPPACALDVLLPGLTRPRSASPPRPCASHSQRYKQLLFYATKLEPFPEEAHNEDNKVKGCVSQVGAAPPWALAPRARDSLQLPPALPAGRRCRRCKSIQAWSRRWWQGAACGVLEPRRWASHGCASEACCAWRRRFLQVWVTAELQDGKIWWKADSDSQLTKVGGLAGEGWGLAGSVVLHTCAWGCRVLRKGWWVAPHAAAGCLPLQCCACL